MFRSSPNAGGRSAYQLLWTVDSYSPIQEYRLLYRQIQPYHKVRNQTFLISSSSSLNGKSEQENFSCKKRERKWRTSSVLWTSKSFSVFPCDSYYCCDFIAFNSNLRSVLLPWLKNFCQSSFFFEETQVHKKKMNSLGTDFEQSFLHHKKSEAKKKEGAQLVQNGPYLRSCCCHLSIFQISFSCIWHTQTTFWDPGVVVKIECYQRKSLTGLQMSHWVSLFN